LTGTKENNVAEKVSQMSFEEAIKELKTIVKESAVKGQKHLDLQLVAAQNQPLYQQAMMVVQIEILEGRQSREDVMKQIGLI
jgi:hypothetical protein